MNYIIIYEEEVFEKDKAKLSFSVLKQVQNAVESKLISHPEKFGKPLRNSLKNYRSLRIGDYRLIFSIHKLTVKVLSISHRSIAYKEAVKRLMKKL